MKLKLFLTLIVLGAALAALVAWHRAYTPKYMTVAPPQELPALRDDGDVVAAAKEKDQDYFLGYMLEQVASAQNIFNLDRAAVEVNADNVAPKKTEAPAEYPGKLIAISSFGGTPGAIIECNNPLPKKQEKADPNAPKPVMGAPTPKTTTTNDRNQPSNSRQIQRGGQRANNNQQQKKVQYTSPLKGPGYYRVGDTMVDGALLKSVDFTKRQVVINYSDSDYYITLKRDWEALAQAQQEFRETETKRAADAAKAEESARRAAEEEVRRQRREEFMRQRDAERNAARQQQAQQNEAQRGR